MSRPEMIELDRTGVRRVADAARVLIQRCGSRPEVQREHGITTATLATMIRCAQPWKVNADTLRRLEEALKVTPGAVLGGLVPPFRKPAPKRRRRRDRRPTRGHHREAMAAE